MFYEDFLSLWLDQFFLLFSKLAANIPSSHSLLVFVYMCCLTFCVKNNVQDYFYLLTEQEEQICNWALGLKKKSHTNIKNLCLLIILKYKPNSKIM